VARRALEDLRALGIVTCPAEEMSNDEDTTGVIWVSDGEGGKKQVPKTWMYAYNQDAEIQERVKLVQETVRRLSTSAGGVPKSVRYSKLAHWDASPAWRNILGISRHAACGN